MSYPPNWSKALVLLALVGLFVTGSLWAQGAGELTGLVTDQTGAVVPKVQVTLTNTATGDVRTTETTATGAYRFPALPVVGTYTLKVAAQGFKAATVTDIVVSVGTTVTRDLKLEVGSTTESVNVEAGVQLIQTTDSQVSDLVDQRVWQSMPLETRNQNEFINLVAGVVPDKVAGNTRGAAVNGARGGAGNFMVEGVDNNDQGQGGRGQLSDAPGGAATGISPEAIQEYRVITNSFSAEYGRSGGFVTDTVLKSGTNNWHGSLFEYNRIQALAANHYFSNDAGLKDRLVRNQFGGSLGGAIVKDKLFFFTSIEEHRKREATPTTTTSTTQEFLNFVNSGAFATFMESDPNGFCAVNLGAACPGAFANSSTVGPLFTSQMEQQGFPLGTSNFSYDAQGLYTAGLVYPVPVYGRVSIIDPAFLNEFRWSLKVDQRLGSNDTLTGTFLLQKSEQGSQYGGGDGLIGTPWTNPGMGQNLGITWNHTFTPTLLNTFRAGYLRHRSDFPSTPGLEDMPSVVTAFDPIGVSLGNTSSFPQFFTDNQFQFLDQMSWVKGEHSFKFGGEIRRVRNGSSFETGRNAFYLPYGVEDLVTDMRFGDEADLALFGEPAYGSMYYAQASIDPRTGDLPVFYRGYRAKEFGAFIQDDWRINSRLTLNIGLRYDYFGPPHNFQPGLDSNFYFGPATTPIATTSNNPYFPIDNPIAAAVATGEFQQRDKDIWNKDYNNFAPRFGFAWDVAGNQKFVVRGGAAIAYDRIYNNLFENIRFNYPTFSFATFGTFYNGYPAGADVYSAPFTTRPIFSDPAYNPKPSARHMDENLVSPYYQQYHFGVQFEPFGGYIVETNYVGTMGKKLTGIIDINTFPGRYANPDIYDTTRPNTTMGGDNYRTNAFSSNYHGLQLTFKKAYSNGFQFNTNYTWSKALDYLSDAFNGNGGAGDHYRPSDTFNRSIDYGPADFDLRHRFVASFSYELPWLKKNVVLGGWSLNSIITLQSGTPFSLFSANDANQDGYLNDRVSLKPGYKLNDVYYGANPAVAYFDPNAFEDPVCASIVNDGLWCYGNTGRNALVGPNYQNVDVGVSKKFSFGESKSLELQGNFFNLFNRANFVNPASAGTNSIDSPEFGKTNATWEPRVTQLALRFQF